MGQCRLCLRETRRCKSIFTNIEESVSLAEILTSIANIKVSKDDGLTDNICVPCHQKAREMYMFKLQIERSYVELQKLCKIKRINFNNIHDVHKWMIKIENDIKIPVPPELTEYFLTNSEQSFQFREVELKKQPVVESSLNSLDCLVPEKELLYDYCGNDYEDIEPICDSLSRQVIQECDSTCDQQTNTPNNTRKKPSTTKKQHKTLGKSSTLYIFPTKPIKPVLLRGYKLMPLIEKPRKELKSTVRTVCPFCGKMIASNYLQSHIKIHAVVADNNKYECDLCGKVFPMRARILSHILQHQKPRDFKCDKCVANFSTINSLKKHMIIHTKGVNKNCEICSKTFKHERNLKVHKRRMHDMAAKRSWQCDVCRDTLNSKHALAHHRRVHTGERPYLCQICRQPYSYKCDFNRHCLKKHGVSFKKRLVSVLNEEVLAQERALMKDLILKLNGDIVDERLINPFDGPLGSHAFEHVKEAIREGKIIID